MIVIVAKFVVNEGEGPKFMECINALGEASRAEEGCIEYILHKDQKAPLTFCLIEKWKDQEAVDSHNATPHFTTIVPQLGAICKVDIDLYEPI